MDFFSEQIQKALTDIIKCGILSIKDLKSRIFKCIVQLPQSESLYILENFYNSDTSSIGDREQFLYDSFLDHIAPTRKSLDTLLVVQNGACDLSNKEKIGELLSRTGYTLVVSLDMRKYGGPPPDEDSRELPISDESKLYISGVNSDLFEDQIVPELEKYGKIYQLRMIVNNGKPTGELWVDYCSVQHAHAFVNEFGNKPFLNSNIYVNILNNMKKLYLIGVPKKMAEIQIERELLRLLPTATDVETLGFTNEGTKSDRTATIEFATHTEAQCAKSDLENGKILLFGTKLKRIDWNNTAHAQQDSKGSKIIIISLGKSKLTQQRIKGYFEAFGKIKTLIKNNLTVSIEYESASAAETASVNGFCVIDGDRVEVKIFDAKKENAQTTVIKNPIIAPTNTPVTNISSTHAQNTLQQNIPQNTTNINKNANNTVRNQKFQEKKKEFQMKGWKPSSMNKIGKDVNQDPYAQNQKGQFDNNFTNTNFSSNNKFDNKFPYDNKFYNKSPFDNKFDKYNDKFNDRYDINNSPDNSRFNYYSIDHNNDYGYSGQKRTKYDDPTVYSDGYNRGYSREDDYRNNRSADYGNIDDESNFDISKYGRPAVPYSQPLQDLPPQQGLPPHVLNRGEISQATQQGGYYRQNQSGYSAQIPPSQPPPANQFPITEQSYRDSRLYDYSPVVHDWSAPGGNTASPLSGSQIGGPQGSSFGVPQGNQSGFGSSLSPYQQNLPFERGPEKRKMSADPYRYPPLNDDKMGEDGKYGGLPGRPRTGIPPGPTPSLNMGAYGMNPRDAPGRAGRDYKFDGRDPYAIGSGFNYQ